MARIIFRTACFVGAVALSCGFVFAAVAGAQDGPDRLADVVEVEGIIDPVTSDYLTDRLEDAADDGVHVLILRLDTPGGLDVSMREIIKDILASPVPTV
ncbi:MAG: NfeD family protein, partial [Actinomycetota bacterium]